MTEPFRAPRAARQILANLYGAEAQVMRANLLLFLALAVAGCASSNGPEPPSASPSGAAAAPQTGYARDLPASDFHDYLLQHGDAVVIDVRPWDQWNGDYGHLDNATSIPLEDLETRLKELPEDKYRPIAIYDQLDVRSSQAARRLIQLGYREVVTMQGGLVLYRRAGF